MPRKAKAAETIGDEQKKVSSPAPVMWDVVRVLESSCIENCMTEGCNDKAVATWASNLEPEDEWMTCETCQMNDFGGWPPGMEPQASLDTATSSSSTTDATLSSSSHTTVSSSAEETQQQKREAVDTTNEESTTNESNDISTVPTPTDSNVAKSSSSATTNGTGAPPPPPPLPVSQTQAEEVEEPQEEAWDLTKILSFQELNKEATIKCTTQECILPACSIWRSNIAPTEKWYSCVDCQELDFGGFPSLEEMPLKSMEPQHLQLIATKCSSQKDPTMPSFPPTSSPSNKKKQSKGNTNFVTPPPNSLTNKGAATAAGGKGKTKKITPATDKAPKQPNPKALAIHKKWQQAAEAIGGKDARIVVSKPAAKKLIFDFLFDAFKPMNITDIYKGLKAIVPSPVLSACLQEMALDKIDDKNPFANDSDEEEEDNGKSTKNASSTDPYAASLRLKLGKSQNTNLYYIDHTKSKGLDQNQRNDLAQAVASVHAEHDTLKQTLKQTLKMVNKLLSEPTNEQITGLMETQDSSVSTLEDQVKEAQKLKVNEKHKQKTKRNIQTMASHWRKRKRLCSDFLISMEEVTDGTISAKKSLAGDGQIALDSDDAVAQAAIAYAKQKKARGAVGVSNKRHKLMGTKLTMASATTTLADENFVAVNLDSQNNIVRVYTDDDNNKA